MRLDNFLSQKYNISRNKAQFCIKKWWVKINGLVVTKSSFLLSDTDTVELLNQNDIKYVARSAYKLKWFLQEFNFSVKDFVCIDVWASTWWFSQVLLEEWVKKIYTVDVWTSQLSDLVKNDKRVICFENTDIRNFDKKAVLEDIDLIVVDVSFISLNLIIDKLLELRSLSTKILLLFKPQYEVWKENLTKTWVPINSKVIDKKLKDFNLILEKKWVKITLTTKSVLAWEKGNEEYFILI